MDNQKLQKIITIAKLYHEEGLNQEEISQRMSISVPQVSRLLNDAKNRGYVKTYVIDPFSETALVRQNLINYFDLKDAVITDTVAKDRRATQNNVAKAGADYLLSIVQPHDCIAVTYSDIINHLPQFLPTVKIEYLECVQPNGALFEHADCYQYDTIREISLKLSAFYFYFPAPAVVKNRYVKQGLHEDPMIRSIMEKAETANIALFSSEQISSDSIFVKNGYLSPEEVSLIKKSGGVCNLFGHIIRADGSIHDEELESRVVGMDISRLRQKDYSISIATGKQQIRAILATLRGGYCNVLVSDSVTAKGVLELARKGEGVPGPPG